MKTIVRPMSWSTAAAVAAIALVGTGGLALAHTPRPDQEPEDFDVVEGPVCPAGCAAPFVCDATDASPEGTCTTEPFGLPECFGTPADSELGLLSADDGTPLHWIVETCVPVTYESRIASEAEKIAAAIDVWNDVECSQLCFETPREDDARPNLETRERRLHFRGAINNEIEVDSPVRGVPWLWYELSTGRVFSVEVALHRGFLGEYSVGDYLALMMSAAGFPANQLPFGFESLRTFGQHGPPLEPREVQSICSMYGSPTFCDEGVFAAAIGDAETETGGCSVQGERSGRGAFTPLWLAILLLFTRRRCSTTIGTLPS